MVDWNPDAYRRFAEQRNRPFLDLLDLLPPTVPGPLLDLGCGDGRLTRLAAERLGATEVVAVDSSPRMIESAQAGEDKVPTAWVLGDLRTPLGGDRTWDVVLSNAVLQFLDEHDVVFPGLMARVAPGGWLAVHMPFNHVARSHLLMEEAAQASELGGAFGDFRVAWPQEAPEMYAAWLRDAGFEHVSVQLRTYRHPLEGAGAIVAWMKSGGLQPWLDALDPALHETFLAVYTAMIDRAYPSIGDDVRLLDYTRLLIVGRAPG